MDMNLLEDLYKAYFDARRHKRNTINQLRFEMNLEENIMSLAKEIESQTYKVGQSVCFIVEKPVKREIFAADFRDRVVHHLIFNYINMLFERTFIDDCYSCRKNYGTSYGIKRLDKHIRSCTDNYTHRAYVLKLDLHGYFMSINRELLYKKIERVILSSKNRHDTLIDRKLYLLREIIYNDPTDNCRVNGSPSDWDGLPPSKSLFASKPNCGLPIGNLTSQLFSNIYLNDFDHYVKRDLKMKHYGRYVDDFYLIHRDKRFLLQRLDLIIEFLPENYSLTVHPKKIYLQEISKGVGYLGAYIKPHRKYVTHRTLAAVRRSFNSLNGEIKRKSDISTAELETMQSTLNSYLGYCCPFKTYAFRKKILIFSTELRIHFDTDYTKVRIKHCAIS